MKLVYPPILVEDLYLSGFTLTESELEGWAVFEDLVVGWTTIETVQLPGLGIIARIGVEINAEGWDAGNPLGWRIDITSAEFGSFLLAQQRWRYDDFSPARYWDYYPRLPFLTASSLKFKLFYEAGQGGYNYSVFYLLQDYS